MAGERRSSGVETGGASIVSVDTWIGVIAAAPNVELAHRHVERLEEPGDDSVSA